MPIPITQHPPVVPQPTFGPPAPIGVDGVGNNETEPANEVDLAQPTPSMDVLIKSAVAEAATQTSNILNTWNDKEVYMYVPEPATEVLPASTHESAEFIRNKRLINYICDAFTQACLDNVSKPISTFSKMDKNCKTPETETELIYNTIIRLTRLHKVLISQLTNYTSRNKGWSQDPSTKAVADDYAKKIEMYKNCLTALLEYQYEQIKADTNTILVAKSPEKPGMDVDNADLYPMPPVLGVYLGMCIKYKLYKLPKANPELEKLREKSDFFEEFEKNIYPAATAEELEDYDTPELSDYNTLNISAENHDVKTQADYDSMDPSVTLAEGLYNNYNMLNNFNVKVQRVPKFSELVSKGERLLDTGNNETLYVQLQRFRSNWDQTGPLFKYAKFLLDAGDILHDAEKVLANSEQSAAVPAKSGYYQGLVETGNKLSTAFNESLLTKCLTAVPNTMRPTPANKWTLDDRWYNVQQDKLRTIRTNAIKELCTKISESNILLPEIVTITLTRQTGYFELIKHMFTIWQSAQTPKQFAYKESGRELRVDDICKYYNLLPTNDKSKFITDCVNYCDMDDPTTLNTFINEILTDVVDQSCNYDLNVPLLTTTSFDGCGTSRINTDNCCTVATFDNVYGLYTYKIYTTPSNTDAYQFWHLVTVTETADPSNKVKAVFGLRGNVTINMLLITTGIPTTRKGAGEKGGFMSINAIYKVLTQRCGSQSKVANDQTMMVMISPLIALKLDNISNDSYYPDDTISKQIKDLFVLGNKTIGDLIVTTYKDVHAITTADSLIANSTMYNFLCGNSPILQSVWMQTGGKGWKFTPGVINVSLNHKSKSIITQILSTYRLLQSFVSTTPRKPISTFNAIKPQIVVLEQTYIKIICSILNCDTVDFHALTPLTRFNNFIIYTFSKFNKIQVYKERGTPYAACFAQLLIYENYIIQRRVWNYIQQLDSYVNMYTASLPQDANKNIEFLNNMNKLPKLQTLLISNISNVCSNNEALVSVNEVIAWFPPADPDNNYMIITQLDNTKIKINYQYIPKDMTEIKVSKETNDIKISTDSLGSPMAKIWIVTAEFPYTIETLMQLLVINRIKEPVKADDSVMSNETEQQNDDVIMDEPYEPTDDNMETTNTSLGLAELANAVPNPDNSIVTNIKQRIKDFFESTVGALAVDYGTTELTNQVLTNITAILQKSNLLIDNNPLISSLHADEGDDEPDENLCELDGQCPAGGTKTRKKRNPQPNRKTRRENKMVVNKTKQLRQNKKNTKTRRHT